MSVILRFGCIATLVAACADAPGGVGASGRGAASAHPGGSGPLWAAVADATLVAEPADSSPWRAFLSADGSARRLGDGAPGSWNVDEGGRLCTSFADRRSCWWVVRDGSSEPVFRGDNPGARARLARASPEL